MFTSYFLIIFKSTPLYTFSKNSLRLCRQQHLGNLGPAMSKRDNDSNLQENQELQTTCPLSMTCQINVVNKQLAPPLN